MSLLSDIKFFVRKYLSNPVLVIAIAYIIYKIINKYTKKECFSESLAVVNQKNNKVVLYDDKLKKYIFVDNSNFEVYSADKPDKLVAKLEE